MDPFRVAAYLRSACSVLDFDIGELWCAKRGVSDKPLLKFIQLYTSPAYEDFHSLLVRPGNLADACAYDEEKKHRISPIICRCVCDGGQIVWANTLNSEGLIGRTDMPLNTAVGIPIFSIDSDLFILVLFSIDSIQISPNNVDFLYTLARAASEGVAGFLPASSSKVLSTPNADVFVGVWDMTELIKTYSNDIAFHILPMNQLEYFYDYQELQAFRDIFLDFKSIRDDSLSIKLIESLKSSEVSQAPSTSDIFSDGPGGFTVDIDGGSPVKKSVDLISYDDHAYPVDARVSYKKNRNQFHEFMVAILGMTHFDAAELWLMAPRDKILYVVAALHSDGSMQPWTSRSKTIKILPGQDVPGQVIKDFRPYWDSDYDFHVDEIDSYPRAQLAQDLGVRTAFAVPLPGPNCPSGALVLYSRTKLSIEPLVVSFVLKSCQLIAAAGLDTSVLNMVGIESLASYPKSVLCEWISSGKCSFQNPLPYHSTIIHSAPTASDGYESSSQGEYTMKIHMMGSLGMAAAKVSREGNHMPQSTARDIGSSGKQPITFHNDPRVEIINDLLPSPKKSRNTNKINRSLPMLEDSQPVAAIQQQVSVEPSQNRKTGDGFCNHDGCSAPSLSQSSFCSLHVLKRCQVSGCNKCAQGATKFCIAHGGGRRCTFPGCVKGARDKLFCAAHGGGKRCSIPDCHKSAVGGSLLCTGHGGGRRCQFEGCSKSSQANTNFCVKHGGGRKCSVEGCEKVARGRTEFCAAHGGGLRCCEPNCMRTVSSKMKYCKFHIKSNSGNDASSDDSAADSETEDENEIPKGVLGKRVLPLS